MIVIYYCFTDIKLSPAKGEVLKFTTCNVQWQQGSVCVFTDMISVTQFLMNYNFSWSANGTCHMISKFSRWHCYPVSSLMIYTKNYSKITVISCLIHHHYGDILYLFSLKPSLIDGHSGPMMCRINFYQQTSLHKRENHQIQFPD